MQTTKSVQCAILATLSVCLFLGCQEEVDPPGTKPTPTAVRPTESPVPQPAPTNAPSSVVKVPVTVIDPETGKTVKLHVEFEEGAGAGDDPKMEGNRGKLMLQVGNKSPDVLPLDEDGTFHPAIDLNAVVCERDYLVSLQLRTPTNVDGCAPPEVMAEQFKRVKHDVLSTAVNVVKECWKKPGCGAKMIFLGSTRYCYKTPDDKWILFICYQVKVICLRV